MKKLKDKEYARLRSRIDLDELRLEFDKLIAAGRRWCYYILATRNNGGNCQPVIVVEGYPEHFTLDYDLGPVLSYAEDYARSMNKRLGLTTEDAVMIVGSSIALTRKMSA